MLLHDHLAFKHLLHLFFGQAHGKLLAALLMGVSQTVCLAQKGRNTQTRHIILLNAEGVEFVMENMVSVLKSN